MRHETQVARVIAILAWLIVLGVELGRLPDLALP
jgi:hypothetical protein